MGSFISRLLDKIAGLEEKTILLLGLDAAGKTSLLFKLHLKKNVKPIPTVGFNVERVQYKKLNMTIWDVGGQTRVWPIFWRNPNTDALIFIIDSSDHRRLEQAREEMFNVLRYPNMETCRTVLIFLNKQDLPGAVSPSFMTDKLGVDSPLGNPLRHRDWHVQACCVINGEGLYEGLDWLSQTLTNAKK